MTHERASLQKPRDPDCRPARSWGRVGGRGLAGSPRRVVSAHEGTILAPPNPASSFSDRRTARRLVRRVLGGG